MIIFNILIWLALCLVNNSYHLYSPLKQKESDMKQIIKGLLGAVSASLLTSQAVAGLMYDQNISAGIQMGSGISNGAWTVNKQNNIEVGLRGKLRFNSNNSPENTFNSNGDGTYSFDNIAPPTGYTWASNPAATSIWNYEWSVDTTDTNQDANTYGYSLNIDYDPSSTGTNFFVYDPVNLPGNDNGGNNFVQQNSWNMQFLNNSLNPFMDIYKNTDHGTYDFVFNVFNKTDPNTILASTRMQIIQGNGGAVNVSEPSISALFTIGLISLGLVRRRRQA